MKKKEKKQTIHFIGIGGIGISALARWFLAQGWVVSGSDLSVSTTTKELTQEGVKIKIGHAKSNLPRNLDMVVYSNAITSKSPGYPELEEAKKRGLKPMSYPQTLGCLTEVYKTIAIAGSAGKSTTTALIGLILKDSPLKPTIVVGTKLSELGGKNFHLGKTHWLVLEADEYRDAFLHYHPDIAVVTNIEKDHLDFYKGLPDLKKHFLQFLERTKLGGTLVLNRDSKNLFSLSSKIKKIAEKRNLKVLWYSIENKEEVSKIKKCIQVPGLHNISNALAAFTVSNKVLNIKESSVLKEIGKYRGAWRRMEYIGEMKIVGHQTASKVYDDYAHHPLKIKAALQGFREKFPKSKIICVFQPHQAKRLKALYKEFLGAFKDADAIVFLPTYEVAGRDKIEKLYTSEKLTEDLREQRQKREIVYLSDPKKIKKVVTDLASKNSETIIVMMGAGNIVDYTSLLLS